MFGENSKTKFAMVSDGTSNTFMVGESTFDVFNGRCSSWAYRGWVMTGIDPAGDGINNWFFSTAPASIPGRLGSWGRAGSMHIGGAHFTMADGAVRFVSQNMNLTLLGNLSRMADKQVTTLSAD